jgi:hypothetical protein
VLSAPRDPGCPSGSPHHDQHRRGLLEFLAAPLDSLALLSRFGFANPYGFWKGGVDVPQNG